MGLLPFHLSLTHSSRSLSTEKTHFGGEPRLSFTSEPCEPPNTLTAGGNAARGVTTLAGEGGSVGAARRSWRAARSWGGRDGCAGVGGGAAGVTAWSGAFQTNSRSADPSAAAQGARALGVGGARCAAAPTPTRRDADTHRKERGSSAGPRLVGPGWLWLAPGRLARRVRATAYNPR